MPLREELLTCTLLHLQGRWTLIFTTRPDSASPIQRTFVGVDRFRVVQEIDLASPTPRCNNIVEFGAGIGELKVEAEASTDTRPLSGFTPRVGDGLILGMALFGRSDSRPPARPNMRIDFQFDRAAFSFRAIPFKAGWPRSAPFPGLLIHPSEPCRRVCRCRTRSPSGFWATSARAGSTSHT